MKGGPAEQSRRRRCDDCRTRRRQCRRRCHGPARRPHRRRRAATGRHFSRQRGCNAIDGRPEYGGALQDPALRSTTLAVVATNIDLPKTALTKIAMMANCGAGRAIRPYHTTGDGDQLFAVSTARVQRPDLPITIIGALAADLVADAIVRAVRAATSVPGWPAIRLLLSGTTSDRPGRLSCPRL